jgi:DNA-binding LytR/AlgR family response regulator
LKADATEDLKVTPRLLVGEREHRLYPLDPQKIDYFEADGNYVSIRSGTTAYISRDTIKRLAAELAQLGFIRIGRSLLVNIRAVAYAQTLGHGRFAFTLSSGACLHSGPAYRDAILQALPLTNRRPLKRAPELARLAPLELIQDP